MGGDISKLVGVTPDLKNGVEYSVFAKYCPEIMDVSSDFYAGGQPVSYTHLDVYKRQM